MVTALHLLESASTDIQAWSEPIIKKLDRNGRARKEIVESPELQQNLSAILCAAFHQNFVDSEYMPDGIHLSYLKKSSQRIRNLVIRELRHRPDLYGYIARHIEFFAKQ
jgi:hypothetical protein